MGEKDIISKQVIRHLAADLANYLLGLDIEPASLELIETEQQRVEDRRADLVAQVRPREAGPPYVLHIEIQNNNDASMPWRMLRYLTDIRLRHTRLPVRQHLIYIGAAPLAMPAGLREPDVDYRYGLLDMHRVDCAALLAQDNPDALVLAILCDFGGREPQSVVDTIFLRLRELVGDDSRRLREYIDMIEILSENRDLESNIKEAEKMLTQVDIERLPSYALGMERGMEKGIERGIARGMEKGLEKGLEKGMEQGLEQGLEQGMVIGSDRERLRLARNLLDLLGDELIAERTGLALETVARLRKGASDD
jgi:predicted transposase YdaD